MTPQQRHIEAATRCVNDATVSTTIRCDPPDTMTKIRNAIAAALADAENRAAWDGWDRHRNWAKAFWAQNYGDVSIVLSSMEERYGPRPADAAKEVGNE